jgi:hypothetical protein
MTQVLHDRTDVAVREPDWMAPRVALPITSHEDYVQVADALKEVKSFTKQVQEFFAPLKEKAHAAWKALTTKENETLAPARAWEAECKTALATWDAEQERLRLEEQRRLEAVARQQEEQRRLEEAAALEAEGIAEADKGKLAEAERLIDEPVETPVVVVEKATPQIAGISFRENWDARVVDLQALIRFVAQNPTHQNLLQPNLIALRAQAKSLKGNLSIPGVKPFSTRVVAAR